MKQKIQKTIKNVQSKILATKDALFQTTEQEVHNWIFSVIKKDFFSIPLSIRVTSFSLFLFMLWWGLGADAYFSLYIERIVDNVFWIALIGAILPLSRLLFALPIGELNDNTDRKSVLLLSKIMYILCWILFFLAGTFTSPWLLLIAVIFNGMASATLFITYESYIRTTIDNHHSEWSWGLYFSSLNAAYVLGSIISALLILWIDLHFLYLFIVLFSILSLFTDNKIPFTQKKQITTFFAKHWFLREFIKKVFSLKPFTKTYAIIKTESRSFFYSLWFEGLWNILWYIGFLFIPLIAEQNHLSLSQIALLFALMRIPYLTNFFTAERSQHFNKKLFIAIILLFLSFLYAFLWFDLSFGGIMIISFGIALGLSIIRPIISALISEHVRQNNTGSITGVQQFTAGIWSITWSIGFGIVSSIFWLQTGFFLIGLSVFVLAIWGIGKKMKWKFRK